MFHQTNTLTTGTDVSGVLIGSAGTTSTAGNDTFVAGEVAQSGGGVAVTLTAGDTIDGGAGADVLNIVTTAAFAGLPVGASIKNIETINVTSGAAVTFSTAAIAGVENLNVVSKSTAASTSVTAAATTDVVVTESDLKPSSTSQLIVNGGKDITVSATGTTTNGTAFTASTGAGAEILVGSTAAAAGKVSVVSSFKGADTQVSGDIFVKGGTDVTVTQSLTNTTVAETNVQGAVSVVGGSGTTSVTVNQDATATAATAVVGKTAGAVTIADANSASLTAAGTITTATLNNYGDSTINSGALTTVNVSGTGGTLGVTAGGLTTAVVDTLALNVSGLTGGGITLDADYKTLNLTASGTKSTVADVIGTGVTTLNLLGSGELILTAQTFAAAKTIVSTNSAGVTLGTALGTDVVFTGGAGKDTITLGASTKAINMGAGDDVVTLNAAALGAGGSLNGGDGRDTIVMNSNGSSVSADPAITGFEVLRVAGNAAAGTHNANGFTALEVGSLNGATSLTNVAAGTSLTYLAAPTATTAYILANATGTADVLNVTISSAAAVDAGTLTAAGIETVNISSTDTNTTAHQNTLNLNAAAATSITVNGNAGLAFTNNAANSKVTNFDASGVTGTAANGAVLGVTYASQTTLANAATTSIKGGSGNDILTGGATADTIFGGAGNDTIEGGFGADVIDGGTGINTLLTAGMIGTAVEGLNSGTSTGVVVNLGATALTAATINTALGGTVGIAASLTSVSAGKTALIYGTQDALFSTVQDSISNIQNVVGTGGADFIVGNAAANVITGGLGADILTGGAGADTFVYNTVDTSTAAAMDTITDFEASVDFLSFDTSGDGATTNDAALAGDVANEFLNGMATGTLATAIAADTTLAAAITEFLAAASFADNDVAGFVFQGDTFVVHADANNAAGNIVKLDGVVLVSLAESGALDTFTGAIA